MKDRRVLAIALAALLCCACLFSAQAETEYPPRPQGVTADLAAVLGDDVIQDLEELSSRLEKAADGHIYVLTRHFLGGVDAQRYADKVFEVWGLNGNDALLLMVIGEESYALALGASAKTAVSAETRTALLASSFRTPFLDREYDKAVSGLSLSLAQSLAKAKGETLDVSGLFGQASASAASAAKATPKPQSSSEFWNSMFARDDYNATETNNEQIWTNWKIEWNREENSINWRSIIIWALVIYFLFFRKKRQRPPRSPHPPRRR